MKKNQIILISVLVLVCLTAVLLLILFPSQSVWDIAELIKENDDFYFWISAPQYHNYSIGSAPELFDEGIKALNGLKLSRKQIGERVFGDAKNYFVLENIAEHEVQYFLFNEDFTEIWTVDNSWIEEHSEITQYEEICPAYKVKNPWAVKRFFEKVCEQDTKYDT